MSGITLNYSERTGTVHRVGLIAGDGDHFDLSRDFDYERIERAAQDLTGITRVSLSVETSEGGTRAEVIYEAHD